MCDVLFYWACLGILLSVVSCLMLLGSGLHSLVFAKVPYLPGESFVVKVALVVLVVGVGVALTCTFGVLFGCVR